MRRTLPLFCLLLLGIVLFQGVHAQDSSFVGRVRAAARHDSTESALAYQAGRVAIRQHALLEEVKRTIREARNFMKTGIDTLAVAHALDHADTSMRIVADGVFTNKGSHPSQRNLSVSAAILAELHKSLGLRKTELDRYTTRLVKLKDRLDSLTADPLLYAFPGDSAAIIKYASKLSIVGKDVVPTDSSLKLSIARAEALQLRMDYRVFELGASLEEVERMQRDLSLRALAHEFPNLWEPAISSRPVGEILQLSRQKEQMALTYYLHDNLGRISILVILILLCWIFIRSLHQQVQQLDGGPKEPHLLLRYRLLSALLITISVFQFMLLRPPFIVSATLWSISAISLTIIFRGYISAYWMRFWLMMLLFFFLSIGDNLILQASRPERWFMAGLSLAGIAYTLFILANGHTKELREKGILYFIAFVLVFETASLLLNAWGRFNLAKTFLVAGYTGVVIAIFFLWTVRLVNQGLSLALTVYKYPDRRLFFVNFNRIGDKAPTLFYVFLVVGWCILVGRHFYGFQLIAEPLNDFLTRPRTLGEYDFSISSLLLFGVILVVAVLLSQLISFFTTEPAAANEVGRKKISAGSWLLLIRIGVICLGLFFAFAAAGIPIDRLTIILGAVGVGVGLGLQSLVTNLVSGLILSFEKPVHVGDIIEINGQLGTMKSIGFRSSIVTNIDGGAIVIPNGELLNNHVVNWTMGRNIRREILRVSVSYGSDLEQVHTVLSGLLNDERILPHPAPQVFAKEFGDSAVAFDLVYWARSMGERFALKSDLITAIDRAFREAGIVIPFPQQDVHVKSMPERENPS
ncbi:mechanosensitive ion channel family protein [Chitinophaga lutea]